MTLQELRAATAADRARDQQQMMLARRRRVQQAAQASIDAALGRAAIPPRFRSRTLSAYRATCAGQQYALGVVRGYAQGFEAVRQSGQCLVLAGSPGTGKTHLACALLREVIAGGHTGLFVGMGEALMRIRSTYSPGAAESEAQVLRALIEPDLLVMDEVGRAIGTPEKRGALLHEIVEGRYREMRPTVLIGNQAPDEMAGYIGEHLWSRLMEGGEMVVRFDWSDYRRGGRDTFEGERT